jgi:hypothetical protein
MTGDSTVMRPAAIGGEELGGEPGMATGEEAMGELSFEGLRTDNADRVVRFRDVSSVFGDSE